MAKTVEDFFNIINESLWHDNISSEAEMKFDKLIESLKENKQEIIDSVTEDIKRMEKIQLNENNEFNYAIFKKWLNKYLIETMQDYLEG